MANLAAKIERELRSLITHPVVSLHSLAAICKPKSIVHLREELFRPDTHSDSLRASRDWLDEDLFDSGFFHDGDFLPEAYAPGVIRILSNQGKTSHLISETTPSALITLLRVFPFGQLPKFLCVVNLQQKVVSSTKAIRRSQSLVAAAVICKPKSIEPLSDAHSASLFAPRRLDEVLCGIAFFHDGDLLAEACASLGPIRILSNQGESSGSGWGSGGGAGEGRNGGNQGVGGGAQREGIGNERRGNSGRNHGGANSGGDDDGDDHGGWVGYRGGERGPMGPGPHRWEEIQLFLNAQMIGTLESFAIRDLPARAKIFRVVSLAFNSVALVVLSASIGRRLASPILARIPSWIGSFATLLAFISMIAMAFSASFIP